jgi:hypothetical protein
MLPNANNKKNEKPEDKLEQHVFKSSVGLKC